MLRPYDGHNTTTPAARPRARRVAVGFALGLAALLLALYLGVSAYAASVVTWPQRDPLDVTPAAAGATFEEVTFPASEDGVTIAGWFLPSDGATGAVVLVHGKDSSRSSEFGGRFVNLAAELQGRGLAVLMIDMRGHGASGDARFSFGLHERRDLLGAVEWLKTQGFAPGSIGVLGISMGAAAAIGAAAESGEIGALVADCSYAEIYPLMRQHWTAASGLPDFFLPSTLLMGRFIVGEDLSRARPADEIDDIGRPVLIVHGAEDTFTPVENGRQLAAANPAAEYWEVPGAPHAGSYAADPERYTDRVADFFARHLAR
jgi:uncharacterized protein